MSTADIDILALTTDEQLLEALREAVHGLHRLHCAGDAAEATALAAENLVGVLVTDVALDRLAEVIAPLDLQAPGLVTIVAGDRDHGNELLQLNNSGPIFRFLLKPVPTGQLRLYVEAAVRQHVERVARGPRPASLPLAPEPLPAPRPRRRLAAAGVAGAVLMAGAWLLASQPEEVALAREDTSEQSADTVRIRTLLSQARQAEQAGQLVEPPEQNALDLYARVLALDPNQRVASAHLAEIADRMFDRAETALSEGRLDIARKAIADAKRAIPGHPRLAYLNTRVEVEEQRTMISQALVAAGTGDMHQAAGLIDEAAQVRLGESGAVSEARAELARRGEVQGRIDDYLRLAQTRVGEGRLIEPPDDNAVFYLRAALVAGARDAEVAPQAAALAAAMLAESATAMDAGRFDRAAEWLARAREVAPDREAVATAEAGLVAAVERSERLARWQELANERLTRGQLVEPAEDSAAWYLSMIRAEAPDYPGLEASSTRLAAALTGAARVAIDAQRLDDAARQLEAARRLGVESAGLMSARDDLAAAQNSVQAAKLAAASAQLKRNKYVAPEYPPPAERRQIEGRVELALTVDATGKVKDVEVTKAQPRDTFENAAIAAAKQWEYQPAQVDGVPVETRTLVAIDFNLE